MLMERASDEWGKYEMEPPIYAFADTFFVFRSYEVEPPIYTFAHAFAFGRTTRVTESSALVLHKLESPLVL
jgi:hypothetical protein